MTPTPSAADHRGRRTVLRVARTVLVAAVVAAGALLSTGVASASPSSPPPSGSYQTCVSQGVWKAVSDSWRIPVFQRGQWLSRQIAKVTRDCRDRYPSTYTVTTRKTVGQSGGGVDTVTARCAGNDRYVSETLQGNVRVLAQGILHRPDGYFVTYRYNRGTTDVKLTVTCRR